MLFVDLAKPNELYAAIPQIYKRSFITYICAVGMKYGKNRDIFGLILRYVSSGLVFRGGQIIDGVGDGVVNDTTNDNVDINIDDTTSIEINTDINTLTTDIQPKLPRPQIYTNPLEYMRYWISQPLLQQLNPFIIVSDTLPNKLVPTVSPATYAVSALVVYGSKHTVLIRGISESEFVVSNIDKMRSMISKQVYCFQAGYAYKFRQVLCTNDAYMLGVMLSDEDFQRCNVYVHMGIGSIKTYTLGDRVPVTVINSDALIDAMQCTRDELLQPIPRETAHVYTFAGIGILPMSIGITYRMEVTPRESNVSNDEMREFITDISSRIKIVNVVMDIDAQNIISETLAREFVLKY